MAYEQNGNEVDSTDDFLAKVEKLNAQLKDSESSNCQSPTIQSSFTGNEDDFGGNDELVARNEECFARNEDFCQNSNQTFSKGDIRFFAEIGQKTVLSSRHGNTDLQNSVLP